jgi:hypothetical protein
MRRMAEASEVRLVDRSFERAVEEARRAFE